jgi:DNA-binding transcriptional ArsR family regulator
MSLESAREPTQASALPPPVLDDPIAIRALAHPIRLKLFDLVGREGPITSADAARDLGISQALASHHMHQLAKYGYVEPAPAPDQRARPWRVTHTSWGFPRGGEDPDVGEATEVLEQMVAEGAVGRLLDWHQRRDAWGEPWRSRSGVWQSLIYLTEAEFVEFSAAFEALVTPLVERRRLGDVAARPPGAMPVSLTLTMVPLDPTTSGG